MTSHLSTSDLIAAHIAAHGVTRCPAAIVAPSSAQLSQADIEAHQARASQPASDWQSGWQPAGDKRRGNRR